MTSQLISKKYAHELVARAQQIKALYGYGYRHVHHMLRCETGIEVPRSTIQRWISPEFRARRIKYQAERRKCELQP